MARKTDEPKAPTPAEDTETDGEPSEDAPPMNRAERRLEAKRKKGRNPSTKAQPQGTTGAGQGMRGRGFQGKGGQTKGTNTRRSG
jgi:hypothetical protein